MKRYFLFMFSIILGAKLVHAQELVKPSYGGGGMIRYFEYDANGRMNAYQSEGTIMILNSLEVVKIAQTEEFPYLRLLFAPNADKESRVRLIVKRASPETEKEVGATGILEIGPASLLLSADRPERVTGVAKLKNEGAGYRDEVECSSDGRCKWHWFDIGAELTIRGTVLVLGVEIESDPSYPVTFKMTSKGWTLMYGHGKVKPSGASVIEVGQQDNFEIWLPLLKHSDQLAREAAASALGWLGAKSSEVDTVVATGLIATLEDTTWEVRRNAAEALGKLKYKNAAEALNKLLSEKGNDGWVSAVAKEALTRIGEVK